jgi:hypothetical protein
VVAGDFEVEESDFEESDLDDDSLEELDFSEEEELDFSPELELSGLDDELEDDELLELLAASRLSLR